MKWTAKLITSENEKNKCIPVYWSLTSDEKNSVRLAINVYGADRVTLNEAKKQVAQLIQKLNS